MGIEPLKPWTPSLLVSLSKERTLSISPPYSTATDVSFTDIAKVQEMKISNEAVTRGRPLTTAVFHILLALADQERHGYGIMKEVSFRTGRKIRMGPGTLYGTLKRMQANGLVCEFETQIEGGLGTERRRYYRMTELGREVAKAEAERLESLIEIARAKQLLPA